MPILDWASGSTSARRMSGSSGRARSAIQRDRGRRNTASRLQSVAAGGEIIMSEAVANIAAVEEGEVVTLGLKGKAEPVAARRITFAG